MRLSMTLVASLTVLLAAGPGLQARGFGGYGGGAVGGARGGSYTGPRGGSVQAAQVGGVSRGPLGGVNAGGAEGVRVTTPGGRSYTAGSAGGVGVGPAGGVHAHGVSGEAYSGPRGAAAVGERGGVAVGPFGGVAAGGVRAGGVSVGGGVGVAHSTRYIGGTSLATSAAYVRTGYGGRGYGYFNPGWYRAHPAAWTATRWSNPNLWAAPGWYSVAGWCGIPNTTPPYAYDYGSDIVIENDNVYIAGEPAGTVQQYAQQATDLADVGRKASPPADDEWQPLGVFGMIQGEGEKTAQHIFQLGLNKAGVIRGNYYDAVADTTLPVYGSMNKDTQKLAWSIGDRKTIVFEAGLNNLTRSETTVLVHYGTERTQQMVLVRLDPAQGGAE